jgi:pyruvate/2-oxoglutarate dehydrogenase complex dihydrolipoamide dehydrogenase (E3) component
VLIAALGAKPAVPPIEGIDGANVFHAEDMYLNTDKAGKKIAVLGGGLVGVELAIYLAQTGKDVTIIEMLPQLNNGGNILHQLALDVEIKKHGIKLMLEAKAVKITRQGVSYELRGEPGFLKADTVVNATGQVPLLEEAYALRFCAPEFYLIGDCTIPKNIMHATDMADAAARNL